MQVGAIACPDPGATLRHQRAPTVRYTAKREQDLIPVYAILWSALDLVEPPHLQVLLCLEALLPSEHPTKEADVGPNFPKCMVIVSNSVLQRLIRGPSVRTGSRYFGA